jgi:hypothetical protein
MIYKSDLYEHNQNVTKINESITNDNNINVNDDNKTQIDSYNDSLS